MLKRKMWLVVGMLTGFFLIIGNVKGVMAVASCSCNADYFRGIDFPLNTNIGLGPNQTEEEIADYRQAFDWNNYNCPDEATYLINNDTRKVYPQCREDDNNKGVWKCRCLAEYYWTDIAAGGYSYKDKETGDEETTPEGKTCEKGDNCCVCTSDGINVNLEDNFCNSGLQAGCADILYLQRGSPNCSCIQKPIAVGDPDKYINTALGMIPIDINEFSMKFVQIIFGIAGGIAFLLMVYGFILMSTSGGDEKKVQGAKETVTSAITGLLVSIFALFIFRLIAVNILHIPGIN